MNEPINPQIVALLHEIFAAQSELRKRSTGLSLAIKGKGDLQSIKAQTQQIIEVLDDLDTWVVFSRVELNPEGLEIECRSRTKMSLHGLFARAITHLKYHKKFDHMPATIQILCNDVFLVVPRLLVDNAVKYSPTTETCVTVEYGEEPTRYVSVTSLGPRIERNERVQCTEKIFEKGKRGLAAEDSGVKGMGLGLYYAKTICESHGFILGVSQKDGPQEVNGKECFWTTFTITFPIIPIPRDEMTCP